MGLPDIKISDADYAGLDVASVADQPEGSAAEIKALFDRMPKQLLAARINTMIDELTGTEGAAQIGAAAAGGLESGTVQGQLYEVVQKFGDLVSGVIPDGSVDAAKLQNGAVTPPKMGFPVGVTRVSQMEPQNTDWAARGMKPGASWVRPAFTLTNAVNNPLLTDAVGWTAAGGTVAAASGVLTATGNGTAAEVSATGACTITGSGTFAVFAEVQQTNSVASAVRLSCGGQTQEKQLAANTWTPFCILTDTPENLTVSATYPTAASAGGMAIQIRKAAVVNLTAPVDAAVEKMTRDYAEAYFPAQAAAASWYVPYRRWICTAENVWQLEQNDGRVMQYCLFPDSMSAAEREAVEADAALKAQVGACEANAKIGTIMTSVRNTLGQKWALCNGDAILKSDFPEAFELLPGTLGDKWDSLVVNTGLTGVNKIKRVNNLYIAVGYITINGYQYCALAYASTLEGTWVTYTDSNVQGYMYDVDCGNGYWAACGSNTSTSSGYVWSSVDLSTWSRVTYTGLGGKNTIVAANGVFVAMGVNTSNALYTYVGSIPGALTQVSGTQTAAMFSNLVYGNGQIAMIYANGGSAYARISSDNGVTWSQYSLPTTISWNVDKLRVCYTNGYFFAWMSSALKVVYYGTSLSSVTELTLPYSYILAIVYHNNLYAFFTQSYLLTSKTLGGSFTSRAIGTITASSKVSDVMISESALYVHHTGNTLISASADEVCLLPIISETDAYAYIKVR